MKEETKVALIGAAATIIAAIIGGIFLLRSVSGPSPSIPPANTSNSATGGIMVQTSETQPSTPSSPSQGTHAVDIAGATSKINSFCEYVNSGALQQAYNLTSSNYQSQHNVSQFTGQFSNADISRGGCLHNQAILSGNSVIITLTMSRIDLSDGSTSSASYMVTLLQDSQSGFWMIDSIQPQ